MTIGKRIAESVEKAEAGDAEAALVTACIAVDATAKREHAAEKQNNRRYKAFLRDYAWLIGFVGLRGLVARRIRVPSLHPDLRPEADGTVALEDVLRHLIH